MRYVNRYLIAIGRAFAVLCLGLWIGNIGKAFWWPTERVMNTHLAMAIDPVLHAIDLGFVTPPTLPVENQVTTRIGFSLINAEIPTRENGSLGSYHGVAIPFWALLVLCLLPSMPSVAAFTLTRMPRIPGRRITTRCSGPAPAS